MKSSHNAAKSEQSKYMPQEVDYATYPKDLEETIKLDIPKTFAGTNRLPIGSVILGTFLGKGAFGQVYKGEWNNRPVAIKEINIALAQQKLKLEEEEVMEALEWEISRLSTVSHPNIVQFYGLYEENKKIFLIMEFCEGGDLNTVLQQNLPNISWSSRWQWALEIAQGLVYLHHQGVLHRDLKAENVLLDQHQRALLADLGVAQVDALLQTNEAEIITKGLQDQRFISPEGLRSKGKSTFASDIYALGLVFWQIATSGLPRKPKDIDLVNWYPGRAEGHEREPIPLDCPEEFKTLILDCWQLDPDKRPTAEHVVERLSCMAAQFHAKSDLVTTCEQIEELIHHQRLEILKYTEPFLTEYELRESAESFWEQEENNVNPSPLLQLSSTFEEFLANPVSSTLVLLGEAGLGKTLSTYQLASELMAEWWRYLSNPTENETPYLPVLIRPTLAEWSYQELNNALAKALSSKPYKAISGNTNARLLVIVDGYDECKTTGAYQNLAQQLGVMAFPNAKLLVTCRTDAVERAGLQNRFNINNNLKVRYFLPFNIHQLLNYLKCNLYWDYSTYQDYKQKLAYHRELRTVLRNPFVLSLFAQSWETMCQKDFAQINRFQIYEGFVEHWLNIKKSLLPEQTQITLIAACPNLIESFRIFASDIAFTYFRRENINELSSPWMSLQQFIIEHAQQSFEERQKNLTSTSKLRALLTMQDFINIMLNRLQQFILSSPLKTRSQAEQYEFSHKSFFEYFIAKRILHLSRLSFEKAVETGLLLLNNRAIQEEPESLIFVREGKPTQGLKDILFQIIDHSKQNSSIAQSSANAITILNAIKVSFSNLDLSNISIIGANLTQGIFDSTNFSNSNLTAVNFAGSWLENTNFTSANMQDIQFGEKANLTKITATCCSLSKNYFVVNDWNKIKLYDQTFGLQHTLELPYRVTALALSPNNLWLAAGSNTGINNKLQVWLTFYGVQKLKVLDEIIITSLKFSSDSKWLAVGCHVSIKLLITPIFEIKKTFYGVTGEVTTLDFSLDNKWLISGHKDKSVALWSIENFKLVTLFNEHKAAIKCVVFSPCGQFIVACSLDKTINLWDINTLQLVKTFIFDSEIYSICFNPAKPQELAISFKNHLINLWNIDKNTLIKQFAGHQGEVNQVLFSIDAKQLVSISKDGTIRRWTADSLFNYAIYQHPSPIISLRTKLDSLILISQSNTICSYWSLDGQFLYVEPSNSDNSSPIISNANQELYAESDKTLIRIYDRQHQLQKTLKGHTQQITSIVFINDNQLVSCSLDKSIKVWNIGGKNTFTLKVNITMTSMLYLATNQYLITGSEDGYLYCWQLTDKLQLLWCNGQAILHLNKVNITKALNLSYDNIYLLNQQKSIGTPIIYINENEPELHVAAARDNLLLLQKLLPITNINEKDSQGKTALVWASCNGHLAVVELLLSQNAAIDAATNNGITPLCIAAFNGHLPVVELLLVKNAKIDATDNDGTTPLLAAAQAGHPQVIELLLAHDAEIDTKDNQGRTPLWVAASNGHLAVVELLLAHDAEIDTKDNQGRTPLWVAASNGHLAVAELLLAQHAVIDATGNDGATPLWIAAQNGHLAVVELLLAQHAVIDATTKDGRTPLWVAARNGHLAVVELLLAQHAAIDAATNNGMTPLCIASCNGRLSVVELLLVNNAKIEATNNDGATPLWIAAQDGHLPVIELLLVHNAEIDTKDNRGITPLWIATQNGHLPVVELLLVQHATIDAANKNDVTPLLIAAEIGHLVLVELLLAQHAAIDVTDKNGVTPLLIAAQNGHLAVVELLLAQHAAIDATDNYGRTPLWAAAQVGHLPVVELLLAQHATIGSTNNYGDTPLLVAIKNGHMAVVCLLIENGAKVSEKTEGDALFSVFRKNQSILKLIVNRKLYNLSEKLFPQRLPAQQLFKYLLKEKVPFKQLIDFIIENRGNLNETEQDQVTLLMMAAAMESYEATKELIIAGADKNATDGHATILHYACAYGSPKLLTLLLKQGCSLYIPDSTGDYPELWIVEKDEVEKLQIVFEFKRKGTHMIDINKMQGSTNKNLLDTAKHYNATKCIDYLNQLIVDPLMAELEEEQISEKISNLYSDLEAPIQLTIPILFSPKLQSQNRATIETLLNNVSYGKEQEVEAILLHNPELLLISGNVIDCAGRSFERITALQYAVWALDYHMWTMILKYTPEAVINHQLSDLANGIWTKEHGSHISWQNLITSLQEYIASYDNLNTKERTNYWAQTIGGAQLLLPAHVINEYSNPEQSFYPCPNYLQPSTILKTRTGVDSWRRIISINYEYILGENFAWTRANNVSSRFGMFIATNLVQLAIDLKAITALLEARTTQAEQLICNYKVTNKMSKLQIN